MIRVAMQSDHNFASCSSISGQLADVENDLWFDQKSRWDGCDIRRVTGILI